MRYVVSKLARRGGESGVEQRDERGQGTGDRQSSRLRLERALLGMQGGLIATLVMTAYRLPISRSLPPTANFWAKFVGGGEPDQYFLQGIVLHLVYGALAGGVFGAIVPEGGTDTEARREVTDVLLALGYSVALSVFGSRVMLGRILDMDLESDEALVFHLGHIVYGLTLGTWLGSRSGRTFESGSGR